MTVVSLSAEKIGAVNVASVLSHRRNERFLKNSFLLVVFDGLHCPLCIQKFATSVQPDTERASQPSPLTRSRAPESKVRTDRKASKHSSFANMLSGIVL